MTSFTDLLSGKPLDFPPESGGKCETLPCGRGQRMAWGKVDVDEQRMRFVIAVSRGEKRFGELCKEFDISRPTGYQWWGRFQAGGCKAVVEKSRASKTQPAENQPRNRKTGAGGATRKAGLGSAQTAVLAGTGGDQAAGDHRASHPVAARSGPPARSPSSGGKSALNERPPISYGRWISKAQWDGKRR